MGRREEGEGGGALTVPPPLLMRKLLALGAADRFKGISSAGKGLLDTPRFNEVVLWLEEEKIRFRPIDDRQSLRSWADGGVWWAEVLSYAKDLGVYTTPLAKDESKNRILLLDALSTLAVQDIYLDLKEAKQIGVVQGREVEAAPRVVRRGSTDNNNSSSGARRGGGGDDDGREEEETQRQDGPPPPPSRGKPSSGGFSNEPTAAAVGPVNSLLSAFRLPTLPTNGTSSEVELLSALQALYVRLRHSGDKVGEEEGKKSSSTGDTAKQSMALELSGLPIAAQPKEKEIAQAIAVLRLLHGRELRILQNRINDVINEFQQFTSDPKTNSRLGKVGR